MSIRIAVVDSGVNAAHPWLDGVAGGAGFEYERGEYRLVPGAFDDLLGHGTSVASLIHAFCPQAELYAVRVATCHHPEEWGEMQARYPRGKFPTVEPDVPEPQLAEALEWCIKQSIDIVNMSYSFEQVDGEKGPLAEVCRQAYERGMTIVGSYKNDSDAPAYPAFFPTVIGVRRSRTLPPGRVEVLSEANKDVAGWGGPVRVAHLGERVCYCFGTSLTCPHVAAIVGRIYRAAGRVGPDRVFEYLKRIS
ncbi:MAG: S8 family serine peptidase [Isosphaeraceae bacterium]